MPFADAPAIADGVNHFLSHPMQMTAMRKRAWKAGREMTWPVVARRYMESFERARASGQPAIIEVKLDPEAITPTRTLTDIREKR